MTKGVSVAKISVASVKVSGNTAHAVSNFVMDMSIVGSGKGDKKLHHMHLTGSNEADLVKSSKGWLFKTVTGRTTKATMDGKPFNTGE
jgi:hypothetical protein